MSKLHRRDGALWVEGASAEERAEVAAIDVRLDVLAAEHMALSRQRGALTHKFRQRAIHKRSRTGQPQAAE